MRTVTESKVPERLQALIEKLRNIPPYALTDYERDIVILGNVIKALQDSIPTLPHDYEPGPKVSDEEYRRAAKVYEEIGAGYLSNCMICGVTFYCTGGFRCDNCRGVVIKK